MAACMSNCSAIKPAELVKFKQYSFPTEPIPRLRCADPEVNHRISQDQPVVITDSNLLTSALKWDLDYLEENMGQGSCTVFQSRSDNFKYFDDGKLNKYKGNDFEHPTKRVDCPFRIFANKMKEWKPGQDRLYLQQPLNSGVEKPIVDDFLDINWPWVNEQQKRNSWGRLTSNLLLISTPGNVTPCHYDEQQNFFGQVRGHKRCILFSPDQFECLYPHPVYHPHDRQSQVNFDNPDYNQFPKFRNVVGHECIVEPGDVLFIPMYWWHHIETSPLIDYSVSINFWFKAPLPATITYPLKDHQKVAIIRNVEKMIVEAVQNTDEVGPLLQALVLGRYTSGSWNASPNGS